MTAFRSALLWQAFIASLMFAVTILAWAAVRRRRHGTGPQPAAGAGSREPAGCTILRLGFGGLWVFGGILQAQPMMTSLRSRVLTPGAAGSPRWVQDVVSWGGAAWVNHPVQAAAAAVWIQAGLGMWLMAAKPGPLSRLAGLASAGWGLTVWAFGESFGGIFAPGLTWTSGAPGAALIYCIAGALVALPERTWHTARLGRVWLAGTGLFLSGMAVLQAWPGRGFWQGMRDGRPGTLASMVRAMSTAPQPRWLAAAVADSAAFTTAHGFAVNLFIVVSLALIGAGFLSGRPPVARLALAGFAVLSLADWVPVQDLGFLGGVGTDPNSMIPGMLLAWAGYLALIRPLPAVHSGPHRTAVRGWVAATARAIADGGFRSAIAIAAIGVLALGAGPLAAARATPAVVARPTVSVSGGGWCNQGRYLLNEGARP